MVTNAEDFAASQQRIEGRLEWLFSLDPRPLGTYMCTHWIDGSSCLNDVQMQ